MTAAIAVSRLLPDIFEFRFDPGDKIFRCLGPAKKASDLFALAVQDQEGGISGHPVGLATVTPSPFSASYFALTNVLLK